MKKNILLVTLLLFSCCLNVFGQSTLPPQDSYFTDNQGSGLVFVQVGDTNNISEIQVNIGSQAGQTDIFIDTYLFDQSTGLNAGKTYSRTGFDVFLGTGALTLPTACYVSVRTKDLSGNWSSWFEYVSN